MSWGKVVVIALVSTSLMACSGKRSPKVVAMKSDDKKLSCQDIKLEINEADFLKDKAEKTRSFSAGNLFSPWRYPSTYMNASQAIDSSDERIAYLKRVYNIRGCGTDQEDSPTIAANEAPQGPANGAAPHEMRNNFNYQPPAAAPYGMQTPYAPAYGYAPQPYGYGYQQPYAPAPMAPAQAYGMQYQAPYAQPAPQPAPMAGYGSRTNYAPAPQGYQSF